MENTAPQNNRDADWKEVLDKEVSLDQEALKKYGIIADNAVKSILQKTRPQGGPYSQVRSNFNEIILKTVSELTAKKPAEVQPAPIENTLPENNAPASLPPTALPQTPDSELQTPDSRLPTPDSAPPPAAPHEEPAVASHVEENRVVLDLSDEQLNTLLNDALLNHDKVADELTIRNLAEQTPFQQAGVRQEEPPIPTEPPAVPETTPQAVTEEPILTQQTPAENTEPAGISHHDVLSEITRTMDETKPAEESTAQTIEPPQPAPAVTMEEEMLNQILQSQPDLAQLIDSLPESAPGQKPEEAPPAVEKPAAAAVEEQAPVEERLPDEETNVKVTEPAPPVQETVRHEVSSTAVISAASREIRQKVSNSTAAFFGKIKTAFVYPFREAYNLLEHVKEILSIITALIGILWLVLGLVIPSSYIPFIMAGLFLIPNIIHALKMHTSK